MELSLTGDMITAEEGLALGLLNYVVAPEEVMDKSLELMQSIVENAPIAAGKIIKAINEGVETPIDHGMELEAELFGSCARSDDWREGTKAFMEKRKPEFKGK
jgi:enoyl-CoA hydratase